MTKMVESQILERLTKDGKNYAFGLMASSMDVKPNTWLDAVNWLVRRGYAEARNVNRDLVNVRNSFSNTPILILEDDAEYLERPILHGESKPVWGDLVEAYVWENYQLVKIGEVRIAHHTIQNGNWFFKIEPLSAPTIADMVQPAFDG